MPQILAELLSLGLIVGLVMVNKCMTFHKICLNTFQAITKVKICHNDEGDDDDNNDSDYTADDVLDFCI